MAYTVSTLGPQTWDRFAELVERNNGIFGGCWCIGFHLDRKQPGLDHRRAKHDIRVHPSILVPIPPAPERAHLGQATRTRFVVPTPECVWRSRSFTRPDVHSEGLPGLRDACADVRADHLEIVLLWYALPERVPTVHRDASVGGMRMG